MTLQMTKSPCTVRAAAITDLEPYSADPHVGAAGVIPVECSDEPAAK